MTLSLPIPGKKERLGFFYVPYHITPTYKNYKGEVHLRETDTIRDFRTLIASRYEVDMSSFLFTIIADNNVRRIVD